MTLPEDPQIPYLPHARGDREAMLETIGVKTFDELITHIPKDLRIKALKMREGLSEIELVKEIAELAAKNTPASQQHSFLGGGSYRRYVPSVVLQIISRSEFATAYTPYQPEVSQGSLQVIYEFQTAICLLTGMDVANASMYDGPTACAEAGLMAARLTNRKKLAILNSVNAEYRMVTHAYAKACGLDWNVIETKDGIVSPDALNLDADTAGIIVQYPNFFGCFEDMQAISKKAKEAGAMLIVVTDPIGLSIVTPPSELGADIVVGDAQPCGNFLSFGGPSAGYMACKKEYVRQLPGRLAGMTVDKHGKPAFTLTLQTREQHIRRARATSNICTNQALNALAMLVYLSVVGKNGLRKVAEISLQRAHYLFDNVTKLPGVKPVFPHPFFNEFALTFDVPVASVFNKMQEKGYLPGINLNRICPEMENAMLVAVTEMNSKEELDSYVVALKEALAEIAGGDHGTAQKENLRLKTENKKLATAGKEKS
ncbi:MAG: aminomethyl-transferring glycine dehydrogenase subunit GcvPA [Candidatus Melainabacteria bacterium]|nr:aminomethyl-transferring glycine dehydrogenase subunit GcvPA [Candidatus Melainabacteria bacterium]